MRVAILGYSGSGKTTFARWLVQQKGAALLDLDTVAWEPGEIAVPRSEATAIRDVQAFCTSNPSWVLEGCYSNLVAVALEFSPRLVFLNPGETTCLANCHARPWEPSKYASKDEQDDRLPTLLSWVREYYTRDDSMSLSAHAALYSAYSGAKSEFTSSPRLEPPAAEVLELIDHAGVH